MWSCGEDGHEDEADENVDEDNVDSKDIVQEMDKKQPRRAKRKCPVPHCRKMVVHIPRHLVHVHHWSHSQSRAAVTNFNLRKKYTFKSQMSAEAGNRKRKQNGDKATKFHKDYHKKRICPVMGCSACVKRLPAHLKNVHEISPSTDEYKRLLKKALPKAKRPCSVLEVENRLKEEFHKDEALSKRTKPYSDLEVEDGADEDAALPKRKRPCSDLEDEEEADEDAALPEGESPYSDQEVEEGADEAAAVEESIEANVEDEDELNTIALFILTFSKWLQYQMVERKMAKLRSSMHHR